jgi:hypothetical protein
MMANLAGPRTPAGDKKSLRILAFALNTGLKEAVMQAA